MPSEVCSDGICVLGQVRPVTENICFDGVFRSSIKAAAVTRAYQAHQISGRQSGRRTAAEIDGTDFAASLTGSGFLFRLRNDFVGANPAAAAFPSIAAEAAVVGAKRNMRIS